MSEMWDSVAPSWEENADFVDAHMAEATAAMLDSAAIGSGDAVLDLATGPGGAGLAAAERVGPQGRVVLADVAPAMVEVASRRAASLPQVSTLVCDQAQIEAADGSFDAVVCRHGLMFAEPPSLAVREAARVLRPDGRFAAITWSSREANPWLGIVLDAVGEQFGVPFPPPGIAGPFSLDEPELVEEALRAGGMDDVRLERLATPMRSQSLEAWWDRVPKLAGPLAQALSAMEPELRDQIRERALTKGASAARNSEGGVELDGEVLIASASRS